MPRSHDYPGYALHDVYIEGDNHDLEHEIPQSDFSCETPIVSVYLKNLQQHLIRHIEEADVVVGCVAWLTSFDILDALSKKYGVSIIVQKEDFLRPDNVKHERTSFNQDLRRKYAAVPSDLSRYDASLIGTTVHMMSYCGSPTIDAIRCCGNTNATKAPSHPRSHHKFIVLCKKNSELDEHSIRHSFTPYAVWTGSFNFTMTAELSLENAVVIREPQIVNAYFKEWGQVAALSEELNWQQRWCEPQWRLGS